MKKIAIAIALILAAALAAPADEMRPVQGSTPVPDPTLLTTQAQEKAVAALKELLTTRIDSVEREIKNQTERLDGREQRLMVMMDRIPGDIDARISVLKTLMDERFIGVGNQFSGRDVALAQAFLSQKTSADERAIANAASSAKSETATTKQIDSITTLLVSQKQAIDVSLADLKDRIGATDARAAAVATAIAGRSEGGTSAWNIMVVGISVLFGLIGAIGMIITVFRGQQSRR